MGLLKLMNVVHVMDMEYHKSVDADYLESMGFLMAVVIVMGISKIAQEFVEEMQRLIVMVFVMGMLTAILI